MKRLFTFAASALVTVVLCAPEPAEAFYRVGPGEGCQGATASSLSYAVDCGLPTGFEFNTATITSAEVDLYPGGSVQMEAQTCRHTWSSSTLTCSSYYSVTSSSVTHLLPSVTPFTGGTPDDYRYYHTEIGSSGADVLGTYTNNSDS